MKTKKITTYEPTGDSDSLQPRYLFSMTATELLTAIANQQIDPVKIARLELANRGLDLTTGTWIGFRASAEQYNALYKTTNATDYETK